jgi:hypothetical protein
VRNLLELNLPGPLEQLLDILVKVALIPFETEDIIPAAFENLVGNLLLSAHRIECDHATVQV